MDSSMLRFGGHLGLAVALMVTVMPAAATPADARTRHPSCASPGSSTVLQDDLLRVFRTPLRTERGVGLPGTHYDSVFACWRASGKRTRMVMESPDGYATVKLDSVEQPDAPGRPVIAFTTTSSTRSGNADAIAAMNVRTGKVLHSNRDDVRAYQSDAIELSIQEFLVTPAGSLAWIGQGNCRGSRGGAQSVTGVYVIDTRRHEHAERCGAPGADAGPGNGPAAFAGLRYQTDDSQLSWLSRAGLETSELH